VGTFTCGLNPHLRLPIKKKQYEWTITGLVVANREKLITGFTVTDREKNSTSGLIMATEEAVHKSTHLGKMLYCVLAFQQFAAR